MCSNTSIYTSNTSITKYSCVILSCVVSVYPARSAAQFASTSAATLAGLDSLAAAAGSGAGAGSGDPSNGKKGNRFFKSLGFGTSKQEELNDLTHMR